ncbi:MAG: glycosyltransferase family 2 protein [Gammaproteobacteria bacterium]|nr:glycosyltransferase family 2 protein [Gammaproteobacteria bacterium]
MELISIIVPVYDEEHVLPEFEKRLTHVLRAMNCSYEIIFVNDGSTDRSLMVLRDIRKANPLVAILNLSRNFGKEIAMTAGIDCAKGDAVIIIDADLQDPPELIPELVSAWREGFDVVYAKRISRQGESILKKATSNIFYRLMHKVANVDIPRDTGDFRLLSRRAADALTRLREQHRFMKGLFSWIGYNQKSIEYVRAARYAGDTKWSYWKLWNFALEGLTSFTTMPLKLATYIGVAVAAVSLCFGVYVIIDTIFFGNPVKGYPSLMVVVSFIGGVQLIFIGVIGEYIGRMFNETKNRPLYFIDSYEPSVPEIRHE